MKNYLRADDVAKQLDISRAMIYQWAREGKIKSVKYAKKSVRFIQKDIDEFVEKHRTGK